MFLLVFALLIGGCSDIPDNAGCNDDSECVKATCCHASECVMASEAPDCEGIMCSMECRPNTMDCGQGSCKCINNECRLVLE